MSSALAFPQFTEYFGNPDANVQGNITSFFIVGAIVGAFIAGLTTDWIGRLYSMSVGLVIFMCGTVIMAASVSVPMLYVGRIVSGIGIGAVANNTPLYLVN